MSRKRPDYVGKAKKIAEDALSESLPDEYAEAVKLTNTDGSIEIGSVIYAVKPGDGSAREQAASCQRVLGGVANIAKEYATKRYRSNLINWGMLPFVYDGDDILCDDIIVVKDVKKVFDEGKTDAYVVRNGQVKKIVLRMDAVTAREKEIILAGCLINANRKDVK